MERFEPFAGRTRRRMENNTLVSSNESVEKIPVREVDPTKHLFVDDQGVKHPIMSTMQYGADQTMVMLKGGASRLFTNGEDDVAVVPIVPETP